MKLADKYTTVTLCRNAPTRIQVYRGDEIVGEIHSRYVEAIAYLPEGDEDLPHDDPRVVWTGTPDGFYGFESYEIDHYVFEAIKALDAKIDPEGLYGVLDPNETAPEIMKPAIPGM
jgi:hypothetical protein